MNLRPVQILTAALIAGLLVHNYLDIARLYKRITELNRNLPFDPPGLEFTGLKERLAGIEKAGFLTDKDMSAEKNDGSFLMAQYALAPVMLDLDNPSHKHTVLDCVNYFHALDLMKKADAAPVFTNEYGKTLAAKSQL